MYDSGVPTAEEFERVRAQVRLLCAREQIRQRLYGYARALDRLDRKLLAAQFWPDAQIDYGAFYQGAVAGFVDVALTFQGRMRDTQHLIGNVNMAFADARASVESYVQAHHLLLQGDQRVQLLVGARYLDQFEERDSQWRILARTEVMDWGRWLPVAEEWFEASRELPKGRRGPEDLSYRYLCGEG